MIRQSCLVIQGRAQRVYVGTLDMFVEVKGITGGSGW